MLTRYPILDSTSLSHLSVFHSTGQAFSPPLHHHEEDEAPQVDGQKSHWGLRSRPTPPSPPPLAEVMDLSPEADLCRISRCVHNLKVGGYYYEGLSWQQATRMLHNSKVGTFLVRDSENANYMFALSVQTERGPTSIRIGYEKGQFRLDCDASLSFFMPRFSGVIELVEYYMELSKTSKSSYCVWLDLTGGQNVPIRLYKPLYNRVHSLRHLCRLRLVRLFRESVQTLTIARTMDATSLRDIPRTLREFLREYPHPH